MNARPRAWAAAAALCAAATVVTPLRAAHAQAATAADSVAATSAVTADASAPSAEARVVAPVVAAGPTVASASVAVRATGADAQHLVAGAPTNALPAARNSQGQPKALMIVGGAAFLAGALIGDTAGTAIMIGGAGIGLYGLYLYLQ